LLEEISDQKELCLLLRQSSTKFAGGDHQRFLYIGYRKNHEQICAGVNGLPKKEIVAFSWSNTRNDYSHNALFNRMYIFLAIHLPSFNACKFRTIEKNHDSDSYVRNGGLVAWSLDEKGKKVVLVGKKCGKEFLACPGGRVEPLQDFGNPLVAACREFYEEVGRVEEYSFEKTKQWIEYCCRHNLPGFWTVPRVVNSGVTYVVYVPFVAAETIGQCLDENTSTDDAEVHDGDKIFREFEEWRWVSLEQWFSEKNNWEFLLQKEPHCVGELAAKRIESISNVSLLKKQHEEFLGCL